MAPQPKADKDLVKRARDFFKRSSEFEADERNQALEDARFVRLGDQWPDYAKRARSIPGQEQPMLVVNRLQQFRNQIINEVRQQNPGVKFRPVDDHADVEVAEVLDGLARHIEDASRASIAYDTAVEWAVDTGLGYIIVRTGYVNDWSFDQEILIEHVADRFKVYYDPLSTAPDGADATQAMYVAEIDRESAERLYGLKDLSSFDEAGTGDETGWWDEQKVRVAEYWYLEDRKRNLCQLADGSTAFEDELQPGAQVVATREVKAKQCRWCKVAGDKILDRTDIPSSMIPVIPVYGSVSWFQGRRHSYGLIRFGKDPQRAYNYWLSAEASCLALTPKAPYIGPEGFAAGHEQEWATINQVPLSYIEYKPVTVAGTILPPPERQPFAGPPAGVIEAKQMAVDDMKASMGIYDASLGNRSNETSGKAINSRAMQAETGNFHFSDNLGRSIEQVWRVALEMIPRIYDTARVLRILGNDGTPSNAQISPGMGVAVQSVPDEQGAVKKIYDLSVGRYDVVVDVGPSYATKRMESAEKITQLVQSFPPIMQAAGDILVQSMDFDKADEVSERLKKMLPPGMADEGGEEDPEAALQQAKQQMAQMAQQMEQMSQMFNELKSEHDIKMAELQIKQFEAETHRIAATKEAPAEDPDEIGQELGYIQAHAKVAMDEERLNLERQKAERDYELRVAELILKKQQMEQAEVESESGEDESGEGKESAKEEKTEAADALRDVLAQMAAIHQAHQEQMGGITKALEAVSRPRKKSIVFDQESGRPVGIEET